MLDVAWSASLGGQCCGSLCDEVIWSHGPVLQSYLQQEDMVYDSSQYFTFWILLHQKLKNSIVPALKLLQPVGFKPWYNVCRWKSVTTILVLAIQCLVQVRLRTEVLRTPSSTRAGFELMISRSWQYISCHWDACYRLTQYIWITTSTPI